MKASSLILIAGLVLFISCEETIVNYVDRPTTEKIHSNVFKRLSIDLSDSTYVLSTYGDITNYGSEPIIRLRPLLRIYLTKNHYDNDVADLIFNGMIGSYDYNAQVFYNPQDTLQSLQTLQHYTITKRARFKNLDYIDWRIGFQK